MAKSTVKPSRLQPARLKQRAPAPESSIQKHDVPEGVIRKLSDLLKTTDLAEIEVTTDKMSIRVRARETVGGATFVSAPSTPILPAAAPLSSAAPAAREEPKSDLHLIRSPFVGTFYRAPSPQSPSFVEQGQAVSKGQSLCIVEAMKLMNEIEADMSGIIEKIFVENGTPVEFNTPLFGIRKS